MYSLITIEPKLCVSLTCALCVIFRVIVYTFIYLFIYWLFALWYIVHNTCYFYYCRLFLFSSELSHSFSTPPLLLLLPLSRARILWFHSCVRSFVHSFISCYISTHSSQLFWLWPKHAVLFLYLKYWNANDAQSHFTTMSHSNVICGSIHFIQSIFNTQLNEFKVNMTEWCVLTDWVGNRQF